MSMLPPSLALLKQRWSAIERCGTMPNSDGGIDLAWPARRASDGQYIGKLDAEQRALVTSSVMAAPAANTRRSSS